MALIDFYIRNQKLSKTGPKLVADSINYVDCSFAFKTDDWSGMDKWVVFSKGEENYRVDLIDNTIPKEAGLNLGEGLWNVSLFGENTEGTERITTNSVTVEVAKSTIRDGEPLPPIALTEAEQIAAKAQMALDTVNEVIAKAENGEFNGENATPEQIAEAVEDYFEENEIPTGGEEIYIGEEAPADESLKIFIDTSKEAEYEELAKTVLLLAKTDMLPAVYDESGMLCDENRNVILRY